MAKQPLKPLEFVELGSRLTSTQVEELGISRLIEDARLIVKTGLKSILSGLEHLGADRKTVELALLGEKRFLAFRSARSKPSVEGSPGNPFSKPLAVYEGESDRGWYPSAKAVVLGRRELIILGDKKRDRTFRNWSRATRYGIGYRGPYDQYWTRAGNIEPESAVI